MATALVTETFSGSPEGMITAAPAQEISDGAAVYIQDGLVDYPGLVRRRGPVQAVPVLAQPSRLGSGLVSTIDPQGTPRYAVLNGDNSTGYLSAYSDDTTSLVDLAWPVALPGTPAAGHPYRIVDAKPTILGGSLVGTSSAFDVETGLEQGLAFWLGGNKANYTTGTISASRGSTTVTGSGTSWSTNVSPGMWLFANTDEPYTNTLVGYVLKVNSNTSITLGTPSPYAITAKSYTMQSLRGVYPRVTTGRITCDTGTKDINGGNTKFQSQALGTGSWNVYRASDWAWIGKVATVESEAHLTLVANAAVALADDSYIALRADGDWSITNTTASKPGWITAQYAQRQWYLNNGVTNARTRELAFSDTDDPEALDLSQDGNWFPVGSTSIVQEAGRGMMAAYNALLIFKENETFGVFGSEPSQFELKKVGDDGSLSPMSIQPYGGGVIWAGREGIHFYDGVQVLNLTEAKLGDVWKNSVRAFDPHKYRMYSMMVRDHYWLYIEDLQPTIAPRKGLVTTQSRNWVVVINMVTGAVTLTTNVGIRGAIILPAQTGRRVWYLANTSSHGYVCSADDLYDSEGVDTITCQGMTIGPDFYYESKKFNAGDALRLKKFKLLALHYLAQGGDLKVDVVLGLNNFGQTLTSTFPASVFTWDSLKTQFPTWNALKAQFSTWNDVIQGVFVPKRVKFQKQSQHLSFRIYQSAPTMKRVRMGPFQIGYKIQRSGRV